MYRHTQHTKYDALYNKGFIHYFEAHKEKVTMCVLCQVVQCGGM